MPDYRVVANPCGTNGQYAFRPNAPDAVVRNGVRTSGHRRRRAAVVRIDDAVRRADYGLGTDWSGRAVVVGIDAARIVADDAADGDNVDGSSSVNGENCVDAVGVVEVEHCAGGAAAVRSIDVAFDVADVADVATAAVDSDGADDDQLAILGWTKCRSSCVCVCVL